MNFLYLLLLIFCVGSIYPTIIPYRVYLKGKFWWTRTWSPHALIISSITLLFLLSDKPIPIFNVLSGTLMIVSGLGLVTIILFYLIENKALLFITPLHKSVTTIIIAVHHFIMGVVGLGLLMSSRLSMAEFLWVVGLLLAYAAIIFTKGFDVPFILYKKSFIPIKTRRLIL